MGMGMKEEGEEKVKAVTLIVAMKELLLRAR